ncbi:urea transporter [Mucilaginibacter sp. CAU 1740]|uniref:urea transporter n=1 Tax=Mucilaginibacter sp. CAU 1740 TaxID=3140365 RepID=UPI00325C0CD3
MKQTAAFLKSVLNTYAVLFFSQNRVFGIILLLASFLNTASGIAGLACVIVSLLITGTLNFNADDRQKGIYSFNSLLLGIAFGAFYNLNIMFAMWLLVACCMAVALSVIMTQRLSKLGLPMLSLPFIITFWLVLMAANSIFSMGLQLRTNYLLQELYRGPGDVAGLEGYLSAHLPVWVALFFHSLSAVLFQHNILTGMLMSVGMLIHSRIAFSLLIISFIAACGLNSITHVYPEGISYYHLGANVMMAAMAMGSFFTIPSWRSYLLAVLSIPVSFILINGLTGFFSVHALPVFSLPFCVVNIGVIWLLTLRGYPVKLALTGLQHYSPERNLYQFLNQQKRLDDLKYLRLNLPFMGSWTVSQGYDGDITHKGEWGHALDFVIRDDEQKTYQLPGASPADYYCFNKPVIACADGVVETVVDTIEDNAIGQENLKDNWGNTVVLKHLTGLYSKVSHLKKNSVKVKVGDVVKQGDILGHCGSSGRSPEPHLHFQVQATPYIGAKSLAYPFACYLNQDDLQTFSIPKEGQLISSPDIDQQLKKAFDLQPGYVASLKTDDGKSEDWEVFKDAYGQQYIYCKTTGAAAYFINNGNMFYFTSFYGDKTSVLYQFYLAAYKVVFSAMKNMVVSDEFPLHVLSNKPLRWLQDLAAPFFLFSKIIYQSAGYLNKGKIIISSSQYQRVGTITGQLMEASIAIDHNGLQSMSIQLNGKQTKATWRTENI